ncbi:MAG: hypothetical protein AB1503_01275, partial [Bacillota bacterium]
MEGGQSGVDPGQPAVGEGGLGIAVERLAMKVLHEAPFPPTSYGLVVSPGGGQVVFYQAALGRVPSLATVPEGTARRLPNKGNAGQAAWSPDGEYLAYLSTDEAQPEQWMEMWLYSVSGGKLVGTVQLGRQDIGSSQRGKVLADAHPTWTEDGKELHYLTLAGVYRVDRREVDAAAGRQRDAPTQAGSAALRGRLVAKADAFPGEMQWLTRGPVAWAGGGRLLAFYSEDRRGDGATDQILWVVDEGGELVARVPTRISGEGWPGGDLLSWCPDGRRLAWVSTPDAHQDPEAGTQPNACSDAGVQAAADRLSILDVGSGRVAGFLSGLGDRRVRLQGWSPDGSRLALLVSPGTGGGWNLWLVRVPGATAPGSLAPAPGGNPNPLPAPGGASVPSPPTGSASGPFEPIVAQVWDDEKLREARWLAPDRLLALTADDRLLV